MPKFITPNAVTGYWKSQGDMIVIDSPTDPNREDKLTWYRELVGNRTGNNVRLIYADWLEEHGEPDYANFIRTQIELTEEKVAKHNHKSEIGVRNTCERCKLLRREKKLWKAVSDNDQMHLSLMPEAADVVKTIAALQKHVVPFEVGVADPDEGDRDAIRREVETFQNGLRRYLRISGMQVEHPLLKCGVRLTSYDDKEDKIPVVFRRGFIDEIRIRPRVWCDIGDTMYQHHPLTKVRLTEQMPYGSNSDGAWLSFDSTHDPNKMHRNLFKWKDIDERNRVSDYEDKMIKNRVLDWTRNSFVVSNALCELRWPGVEFYTELPAINLGAVQFTMRSSVYNPQNIPRTIRAQPGDQVQGRFLLHAIPEVGARVTQLSDGYWHEAIPNNPSEGVLMHMGGRGLGTITITRSCELLGYIPGE